MMKSRKGSGRTSPLLDATNDSTGEGHDGLSMKEKVARQVRLMRQAPWSLYFLMAGLVAASFFFGYAAHAKQTIVVAGTGAGMEPMALRGEAVKSVTLPAVGNDGATITSSDGEHEYKRPSETDGDGSSSDPLTPSAQPNPADAKLRAADEAADRAAAADVADLYAAPFMDLASAPDQELFENFGDWSSAPDVFVPEIPPKPKEWWGVQDYSRLYRAHTIKRFVPVLRRDIQLNEANFRQRFRKLGQPVLFRMDNLRKGGYTGRAYTFEELRELFPYSGGDRVHTETFSQYRPNAKFDGEVDLGPGLAALAANASLVKKDGLRNLPRNMKIRPDALRRISIRPPPLFPRRWMQRGSLWLGNPVSNTASHSDCCDNIVVMVAGVKRFTIAPPSDFHLLTPRCVGRNKGLCYGTPADPNAPGVSSSHYNKLVVDVGPGEMLYLPAGWFHHVENRGHSGTVMINYWTHGKETCGINRV